MTRRLTTLSVAALVGLSLAFTAAFLSGMAVILAQPIARAALSPEGSGAVRWKASAV